MNEIVFGERKGERSEGRGLLKEAGFENITLEVEYDIITGWITDDGEVKSVTVNDDGKFASGKECRADAEVVITYHTYRSNKPK